MTTLPQKLRESLAECTCKSLKDKGCKVGLGLIPHDHVIVSGKKYQRHYSYSDDLCDFILCVRDTDGANRVATIELKGGDVDEREFKKAHNQLKNGAMVADSIIGSSRVDAFRPFLIKKKTLNPMAYRLLQMDIYKIPFRSFSEHILIAKSDTDLPYPFR